MLVKWTNGKSGEADMDYRDLLKRYIDQVAENEGTSFLHGDIIDNHHLFTKDEWAALQVIRDEAYADAELRERAGKHAVA